MRNKCFSILAVSVIMIGLVTGCDWGRNPVSPDLSETRQTESAVLAGNVIVKSDASSVSGLMMIGVKGTLLRTVPDPGGRFRIEKIPTGNRVVEVTISGVVSEFSIEGVRAGEEIDVVIEVQENHRAVMAELKRKGRPSSGALALEIRPDKWNADWKNNGEDGEVLAKISGADFKTIKLESVRMIGPEGEIEPYGFDAGDVFFIAKFFQSEAIGLIENPKAGESYKISVQGELEDGTFDLSAVITIVGERRSTGNLALEIRPDRWNAAWKDSLEDGDVLAKISGAGFNTIESASVKMVGPGGEIAPYDFDIGDTFFIGKFPQSEAIGLIEKPKAGETYEIRVRGEFEGGAFDLAAVITIVGRPPSSGPLTLAVRPDKWNPAWRNADGEVLAQISGEDFETIQPGTVKMIGPEGEIALRGFDVGGMFFTAKFSQSEAIGLIKDPKAGQSHIIQVTGVLEDETTFTLSATIMIVGR